MGIGIGIVLIVAGLIIVFALNFDLPYLTDNTLGIILIVVGALAVILTFLLNAQRSHSRQVTQTRVESDGSTTQDVQRTDPPPPQA